VGELNLCPVGWGSGRSVPNGRLAGEGGLDSGGQTAGECRSYLHFLHPAGEPAMLRGMAEPGFRGKVDAVGSKGLEQLPGGFGFGCGKLGEFPEHVLQFLARLGLVAVAGQGDGMVIANHARLGRCGSGLAQ